jgi:hypothetical protein
MLSTVADTPLELPERLFRSRQGWAGVGEVYSVEVIVGGRPQTWDH